MYSDHFYAKQEQEHCQVNYPGCLNIPEVRIYCKTEQTSRLACHNCHASWRSKIAENNTISERCPVCADHDYSVARPAPAPVPLPLRGPVADAVDKAMHAEGLLIDVRKRVLQRLAKDPLFPTSAPAPDPDPAPGNNRNSSSQSVLS